MGRAIEFSSRSRLGSESSRHKDGDEALLEAIVLGDKRAMERLFALHSRHVYRFAHRLTGNAWIAEEIVSEVFLAVWRNAAQFQFKSKVATWLLAIARNKAIASLRKHTEEPLVDADTTVEDDENPEIMIHQLCRNAILLQCLTQLTPPHRQILDIVYYREKSIAEAARIVGIPEGTVKSRVATARSRMAELLKVAGVHGYQEC